LGMGMDKFSRFYSAVVHLTEAAFSDKTSHLCEEVRSASGHCGSGRFGFPRSTMQRCHAQ
jgi:hypothetical protein